MTSILGTPLTRVLTALAAAGILAACGSSSSSGAASPSAAVKTYMTAVANGDGGAACGVLSHGAQSSALSAAHGQGIKASSCATLFSQVKAHLTAAQRNAFLNAKITKIAQSGQSATATVTGASAQPTLIKGAGKWLITGGVGF